MVTETLSTVNQEVLFASRARSIACPSVAPSHVYIVLNNDSHFSIISISHESRTWKFPDFAPSVGQFRALDENMHVKDLYCTLA